MTTSNLDPTTSNPAPALPPVVLGAMDFGTVVPADEAFGILDAFVAGGGVWIDTANCYSFWNDASGLGGASERVLGAWLHANPGAREQVRLATKVRHDPMIAHSWPESAEGLSATAIEHGFARSLDRLGLDRVDLLWAHAEDRTVDLAETVAAFGAIVAAGTATRIGAANHAAWRVAQARDLARAQDVEPWSALQLRHSLLQPRPAVTLAESGHKQLAADALDLAHSDRLAVWAYSPLLWGGYVRADKPLPEIYTHPGTDRILAVLDEIAAELDATRNQVVLAWLRAQGISPIVGGSRIRYVDEALAAERVTLQDEHMARFAAAR